MPWIKVLVQTEPNIFENVGLTVFEPNDPNAEKIIKAVSKPKYERRYYEPQRQSGWQNKALRSFSYGGGVQSTACLVLAAQGQIAYKDFLFSDVGSDSENPATLEYLHKFAIPYAEANGLSLRTLQRKKRNGEIETLWGRIMASERSLPIPVRMNDTAAPVTRSCTVDFKIKVISKELKRLGATAEIPAITGLGISTDEIGRAKNFSGIDHQVLAYPLIDLRLSRIDCMKIIEDAGLPVPPSSSCFFCPFHKPAEWARQRRENPELFQKSVFLEQLLNDRRVKLGKDPVWLSRFTRPLDQVFDGSYDLQLTADDELDGHHCSPHMCQVG